MEASISEIVVASIETPVSSRPQTAVPAPLSQTWQELRHEAERRLMTRGVDLNTIRVDALLDAGEVDSIERRFRGEFSLSTRLDGYDLAAAAAAGLVAALVDFLVVRIPTDIVYLGQHVQAGSPLTQWLHSLSIPADNWLAQYFKTSYDTLKPAMSAIGGFGPKTHRLQTFGHDPFVGLVIGTIDIMRGGLTAISDIGTQRTSAQPRFQALALAAHATASAANAGKVAIYQGNPLALNYAQWLRFFQAAFMVAQTKMRSPSEILRGYAGANGRALSEGWPATAVDDPQFPTLIV